MYRAKDYSSPVEYPYLEHAAGQGNAILRDSLLVSQANCLEIVLQPGNLLQGP